MVKSKITVYFFTNGQPFKPPHKTVIDRQKLENNQVIERINRLHYYNGYVVYTLFGELLRSIQEVHNDSAFVAVPRDQCFQPGPYVKVFRQYINEKLPVAKEEKKSNKKKKPITKPLGSSYGCKAPVPRLAKEVRFCPGCRHVAVDTRCKDFGAKGRRAKQDTCSYNRSDPHGECVPMQSKPKSKPRRKKKSGGCCGKKKEKPKPPTVRLRKRDIEAMELAKAKKERKPKSKSSTTCCGRKPTREEQYKRQREKLIKQREKRIKQEEKRRVQQQKAFQVRIKRRRTRRRCMNSFCPCCVKKPEPIWRQPTPHNCVEHLRQARDQAIRRRRALQIPEQSSWESITFPPKFKKKIRGTQTTKDDLKKARKASGKGWSCFGGKKKPKADEDIEEKV